MDNDRTRDKWIPLFSDIQILGYHGYLDIMDTWISWISTWIPWIVGYHGYLHSGIPWIVRYHGYLAGTYLQPHYGNGVFGNVYLSAEQH